MLFLSIYCRTPAKVILVGDRQQLLPVGAGNAYSVLTDTNKISTIELTEIRRQEDAQLLQAVRESVSGDIAKSLEIIDKDTKIIEKHKARMKTITADYTALTQQERQNTVILTAGNSDRNFLNASIRKELKKQKHLSDGQIFNVEDIKGKSTKREFSANDKIIFLQNDNKMGVRNGQTGYVTKMEGNFITVLSDEKEIRINTDTYKKIDYGYAMTTHKAQGITVDRALINLDSSQAQLNNRNAYYVDISRARHKVNVYVDDKEKIFKQIDDFAKKITSEDFLIRQTNKATKKKENPDIGDFNLKEVFPEQVEQEQTRDIVAQPVGIELTAGEVSKLISEHESKLNAELKELIRLEQRIVKEKNELGEGYRDEAANEYFEKILQLEIKKLDRELENLALGIDTHNSAGLMKKLFGNYNQEAAELTAKKLEFESAKDNIIKDYKYRILRATQGMMDRREQNEIDELAKGIARKRDSFFDKKINDFDAKILKIAGERKDLAGKIKDCREVRTGLGDLAKSTVKFEISKEEFAHKEVVEIMRKLPIITKEMDIKVGRGISFGR